VQSALKPPAAKPAAPVQQATLLPVITHNATLLPVITPVKKAPVTAPPPPPAPKAAPKAAPKPAPKTTPTKPRSPAPSNPFSSFNSSGCELDCGISSAMNGACPSLAGVQITPMGLDEEVSGAGAAGCGQGPTIGGLLKFLGNVSGITQDEHCLQDPNIVQCLEGAVNGALTVTTILDLGTTSELEAGIEAAEATGDLTEGELTEPTTFYHGSDVNSLVDILNNGLDASKAAASHTDGPGGFFMATKEGDAEFFAVRNGRGAVIKVTMSDSAISQLQDAGAVIREIPMGPKSPIFEGQEFHVPTSAFDLFNQLRSSGEISVSP
jgi:hypothetical protein